MVREVRRVFASIAVMVPMLCAASAALVPAREASARQGEIEDDSTRNESFALSYETPPALDLNEMRDLTLVLGVGEDQRPLIDDMTQSYLDKLRTNRRKMGDWYKATFMPDGRWVNDSEVWEKARPTTEKYNAHVQKLRENLLADVKLLLNDEQLDRWPKLEARLKRRDLVRGRGTQIGLATVDVEGLTRQALGRDVPLPPETADALQGYQDALDRAAAIAEQWNPETSKYPMQSMDELEGETQEERSRRWQGMWFARQLEQWKPVRDANLAAFRRVVVTLPEEARDRLRVAFYSRATSEHRFSMGVGGELDFDRIENVRGLSDEQKRRIAETRRTYEKSIADKLEREGTEQIKAEDDDPVGVGARRFEVSWTKRWQEKTEAERPVRTALSEILTEEQHEAAGLGKKIERREVPTFDNE